MSFDILGKDIAVLFILAVIFGIATYFYVLHKGKKEKRTARAEDKIILGFEVLAYLNIALLTMQLKFTFCPCALSLINIILYIHIAEKCIVNFVPLLKKCRTAF